ncbi:M23 family metallopeptidase (plasmid) [Cupriavidus necator]|uniref:M23 family peptidase n=1 Tax=Cupriavidus necator TaxID=106590 RepID=A0A367PDG4_CUPNE|nr:M23 family metallopeptidase [Cupriavidus necator]QQX89364.1 M23 family metallopeptidase [Cupriavidus necator]RCJ05046.1 M23 family peptidase [Cupriavidus necator]
MRGYRPSWLTAGVAAVLTLCMAAAMGVAPHSAYYDPAAPRRQDAIRLPDLREQLEKLADAGATYFHEETVQRGDTVATLLRRLGVEDPDAQQFISRDPAARTLFDLQPEQLVQAEVDQDKLLVSLRAPIDGNINASRELLIRRAGGLQKPAFQAKLQSVRNELRYEMRSGAITAGGFFRTMDIANVPEDIVRQLISIFSGVVDFQHDIVQGDRFRIVYEAGFRDGALVRNGRVVAVELVNRAQLYQALWYDGAEGSNTGDYYTFDGRAMARPFLRSPVEFSRLSSGFGWRNHPLHHQWIQHKGVDFAAPTGTRVFATAQGTVDFVGQQTGYGNIVILKHPDGYSTYYAHLSGFAGIQPGQRIRQGQLIAYVGQTGWATGPHLHYELRFNDVPQNPLSVMLMEPVMLTGRARQGFLTHASDMLSRIDVLRGIEVASSLS